MTDNPANKFFAHKGEKIIFWTCITGLVLVFLLTAWRYTHSTRVNELKAKIEQLSQEVERLEYQNELYKNKIDSLENQLK